MKKLTPFKNGLISAFSVIIFSLFITIIGCKKTETEQILQDPTTLSEDKIFIKLTIETNHFIASLTNHVVAKKLSTKDIITNLSKIQIEQLDYNSQLVEINNIFKGNVSQSLEYYANATATLWDNIQSRYSPISSDVLEKECAEVLSNRNPFISDPIRYKISRMVEDGGGCSWRYYICMAGVTAAAIVCHAGCDATALATTAGFGIPACLVLCATMQVSMGLECAEKYCQKN